MQTVNTIVFDFCQLEQHLLEVLHGFLLVQFVDSSQTHW